MKVGSKLLWVAVLTLAWSGAEIFGSDLLRTLGRGGSSISLTIWALFMLSIARGLYNKPGSSSLVGLAVAGMKWVGPSINACHLLGIASIGLIFDLAASLLLRNEKVHWWRASLVGVVTAYGSRVFFVLYATHVAGLERWVEGGSAMALEYILKGGNIIASVAIVAVPLAWRFGVRAAHVQSRGSVEPSPAPSATAEASCGEEGHRPQLELLR